MTMATAKLLGTRCSQDTIVEAYDLEDDIADRLEFLYRTYEQGKEKIVRYTGTPTTRQFLLVCATMNQQLATTESP
jgi:hypothetical protein